MSRMTGEIQQVPCMRTAFLYGIGGGFAAGLTTFLLTSEQMRPQICVYIIWYTCITGRRTFTHSPAAGRRMLSLYCAFPCDNALLPVAIMSPGINHYFIFSFLFFFFCSKCLKIISSSIFLIFSYRFFNN